MGRQRLVSQVAVTICCQQRGRGLGALADSARSGVVAVTKCATRASALGSPTTSLSVPCNGFARPFICPPSPSPCVTGCPKDQVGRRRPCPSRLLHLPPSSDASEEERRVHAVHEPTSTTRLLCVPPGIRRRHDSPQSASRAETAHRSGTVVTCAG